MVSTRDRTPSAHTLIAVQFMPQQESDVPPNSTQGQEVSPAMHSLFFIIPENQAIKVLL